MTFSLCFAKNLKCFWPVTWNSCAPFKNIKKNFCISIQLQIIETPVEVSGNEKLKWEHESVSWVFPSYFEFSQTSTSFFTTYELEHRKMFFISFINMTLRKLLVYNSQNISFSEHCISYPRKVTLHRRSNTNQNGR